MTTDRLFRHCAGVAMDRDFTVLPSHDVAVADGRIRAIRPSSERDPARQVIEAAAPSLLPALITTRPFRQVVDELG